MEREKKNFKVAFCSLHFALHSLYLALTLTPTSTSTVKKHSRYRQAPWVEFCARKRIPLIYLHVKENGNQVDKEEEKEASQRRVPKRLQIVNSKGHLEEFHPEIQVICGQIYQLFLI